MTFTQIINFEPRIIVGVACTKHCIYYDLELFVNYLLSFTCLYLALIYTHYNNISVCIQRRFGYVAGCESYMYIADQLINRFG